MTVTWPLAAGAAAFAPCADGSCDFDDGADRAVDCEGGAETAGEKDVAMIAAVIAAEAAKH